MCDNNILNLPGRIEIDSNRKMFMQTDRISNYNISKEEKLITGKVGWEGNSHMIKRSHSKEEIRKILESKFSKIYEMKIPDNSSH